MDYWNYNWEGLKLLNFEGEDRLLGLWNLLMQAAIISGEESFRNEADAIMKVGPELGFYRISEETVKQAKIVVDNSK